MWIAIGTGISVFLLVITVLGGATRQMGRQTDEKWLFSRFFEKIYDAVFPHSNPQKMAAKFGASEDKYIRNCRIIRKQPNWKREAGMRLVGIFCFALSVLVAVLLKNIIVALLGIVLLLFLGPYQEQQVAKQAKARKQQMAADLPRFIDLFSTAIEIGVPVENAIKTTAQNVPCVVSDELLLIMAETELGAKSWQRALEEVALKYDVGVFSDFVLTLVAAYEKGIPIAETVVRKSSEIKQSNLLEAKERAVKLSNTVLLPVLIFKILPLFAIMLIPIMQQISSM